MKEPLCINGHCHLNWQVLDWKSHAELFGETGHIDDCFKFYREKCPGCGLIRDAIKKAVPLGSPGFGMIVYERARNNI